MGKLGYTLNGFYLVNGSDPVGRFGVVFCQFQLPQGTDGSKERLSILLLPTDFGIDFCYYNYTIAAKGELFGFFNLSETNIIPELDSWNDMIMNKGKNINKV